VELREFAALALREFFCGLEISRSTHVSISHRQHISLVSTYASFDLEVLLLVPVSGRSDTQPQYETAQIRRPA
jgi:hypothetical protein